MAKVYTYEEVANHKTNESLWIVIDNKVYDVSKFLLSHPGGAEVLLNNAGIDVTRLFQEIGHSVHAKTLLQGFCIGEVDVKSKPPKEAPPLWGNMLPTGESGVFFYLLVGYVVYKILKSE